MGFGIMKNVDILFIIPPFHMRNGGGSFFPLGIGYIISSIEKEGYTWGTINCTEIISSFYEWDLEILRNVLLEKVREYNPSVIGVGPCITTQLRALQIIASICKKIFPQVPIFAGGPFASINGQETVFSKYIGIDYLIKGDGEIAVPGVIRAIQQGEDINSCVYISHIGKKTVNIIEDINILSFPYRPKEEFARFSERRKSKGGKQFAMITSRGCPYRCAYCVSGHMKDHDISFRRRENKNVIDEMLFLRDTYGANSIVFYDDLFFVNRANINEEVETFCNMLVDSNVGMTWQIEMRPDYFVLLSEDSLKLMYYAGCFQINLGIEKMSENGLKFLGKTGNRDGLLIKMNVARNIGIKLSATFILGGKDEQESDVREIVRYAKSLPLEYAHFNPLFIYPGTSLYNERFSSHEEWVELILNDKLPWGEIVFENEFLKTGDLLELVDFAYSEFYKDTPYANVNMIEDRFNIKK